MNGKTTIPVEKHQTTHASSHYHELHLLLWKNVRSLQKSDDGVVFCLYLVNLQLWVLGFTVRSDLAPNFLKVIKINKSMQII